MKTKTLTLALATLAALPAAALAQGTYLSAPDGNPTNALIVTPGGNVGIGTTSPNLSADRRALTVSAWTNDAPRDPFFGEEGIARLEVQGRRLTDDIYGALGFYHKTNKTASIESYRTGADDAGNLTFWTKTTGVALAERMRIDNSGNVGIGTITPQAKLEIYNPNSGSGDELRIVGDREAEIVLASTTDPDWDSGPLNAYWHLAAHGVDDGGFRILRWDHGGYQHASTFTITRDGKFGVGTLDPQAKLDVSGKINCTVLELTSDRNQKQDFAAVDARHVLDRLVGLPIQTWAYTNDAKVRHLGPMAQDWKAAYPELGSDDKHIGAGDLGSVALAAIQGLNAKLTESLKTKDAEIAALKDELSALKTDNATFAARFEKLEKVVAQAVPSDLTADAR